LKGHWGGPIPVHHPVPVVGVFRVLAKVANV